MIRFSSVFTTEGTSSVKSLLQSDFIRSTGEKLGRSFEYMAIKRMGSKEGK